MSRGTTVAVAIVTGLLVFVAGSLLTVGAARLSAGISTSVGAASSPAHASVFYVDPAGSDSSGNGTARRPWRTIANACASVPPNVGDTIRLRPGEYKEVRTCALRCKTNLRGSGISRTVVIGSADPLITVSNCMDRGNWQTISRLRLDGQNRGAGAVGLRVARVHGLTIWRIAAEDFRGPPEHGGGALDVYGAWNLNLGHSTFKDSAGGTVNSCSGTIGLGEIYDSKIHDVFISEDRGYGIKTSTGGGSPKRTTHMANVDFSNLNVNVSTSRCAQWNSLAVELYRVSAVNTVIRNSKFNRVISLVSTSSPLRTGYQFRLHNNIFAITPGNNYAIELHANSVVIDHNYFDGGLYPIADFSSTTTLYGDSIHHNVFDNQVGPTAVMHIMGAIKNGLFCNNTIVLRQSSWQNGIFLLGGDRGYKGSNENIANNLFVSVVPVGDKLGLGLDGSTIQRNGFFNIAPRGRRGLLANPKLPLTGSFPAAYVPGSQSPALDSGIVIPGITDGYSGSAPDLGAFEGKSWTAGPRSG